MMIGIFWVYKGIVFGRTRNQAEGDEHVAGIIDSPENHADHWDTEKDYLTLFPELRFSEYMDIPRGRVLYSRKEKQAVVYMDKTLFSDSTKRLIREFFHLEDEAVAWRSDTHYTTSLGEIDRLLG